jgi:phospho-N-acetylmuramoyl-pentapeptide-transferase
MLYWLADLSGQIGFLNVFRYLTVRTGGSMMTALVFVFWLGPTMIDLLRLRQGKGQPIRSDGPQSHLVTKKGTPTMGGLMILSGIVVSTVLWAHLLNPYVWIVLGVTLAFGLIGFYDDYLKVTRQSHDGFSGRKRLAAEAIIAAIACFAIASLGRPPFATSLAFPLFKEMIFDLGWFFVVFGAFIIVGAGNAVNLTDGLDGLAIGPVMIAAGCFGVFSYVVGNTVLTNYLQLNYVAGTGELAVLCADLPCATSATECRSMPRARVFVLQVCQLPALPL